MILLEKVANETPEAEISDDEHKIIELVAREKTKKDEEEKEKLEKDQKKKEDEDLDEKAARKTKMLQAFRKNFMAKVEDEKRKQDILKKVIGIFTNLKRDKIVNRTHSWSDQLIKINVNKK